MRTGVTIGVVVGMLRFGRLTSRPPCDMLVCNEY